MTDIHSQCPIPEANDAREIVAIDLGSNSFHMIIARVIGQGIQIISKHKQRIKLASGLDENNHLSDEAITRGIDCLQMFAERLKGVNANNVRCVATFTLREASNSHDFLTKARAVFPYPIEIISGEEEARLIYTGVSQTQGRLSKKLVIDIGGGSTEFIIGDGFETLAVKSKSMGSSTYTSRFFHKDKFTPKHFLRAQIAAQLKIDNFLQSYTKLGWDDVIGSSGSIKAIREVLIQEGAEDGIITAKRLDQYIKKVLKIKHIDELDLQGIQTERKPVFLAGLAILSAIFSAFNLDSLTYSDAALREGLLFEMIDGFNETDVRSRTGTDLANRHHVDQVHANNVRRLALELFHQLQGNTKTKKNELADLLGWAAWLHEVGLSISHASYHKHSAYILSNSHLLGFNLEQQTVLATLVRFHRKSLKLHEMPEFNLFKTKQILPLVRVLRIAACLTIHRDINVFPDIKLDAHQDTWTLLFPDGFLEQHRLIHACLLDEQHYWNAVGWRLDLH